MMYDAEDKYADIINLPHHVSRKHPQMSMADRAAQFSPFAALTGHDAAIAEAARLTDERPILDESVKQKISDLLQLASTDSSLVLNIVYFVPDTARPAAPTWRSPGASRSSCRTRSCSSWTPAPASRWRILSKLLFEPNLFVKTKHAVQKLRYCIQFTLYSPR